MEANQSPESQFKIVKQRFYTYFKNQYLSGIAKATDKVYAQEYYFIVLFTENPLVPRFSVFYLSLVSSYSHFVKLGNADALSFALKSLPEFNQTAIEALETAMLYSTSYEDWRILHWRYLQAIEDHNYSVLQLIENERRMLKASDSKVIILLALHVALEDLKKEFSPALDQERETEAAEELEIAGKPKLTRSQQVLIAYYISQALGIKQGKNVSKCANALHAFLNLPYSQITNSELYKKLLNPLSFSSAKATILNLKTVREFFERMEAISIIELIDADILKLEKKI